MQSSWNSRGFYVLANVILWYSRKFQYLVKVRFSKKLNVWNYILPGIRIRFHSWWQSGFAYWLWATYLGQNNKKRILYFSVAVWVLLSRHNKISQSRWLLPQKFMSSQFWGLEVQGPGTSSIGVWWGFSPGFVDGCLPAVFSYNLSVHARTGLSSVIFGWH